MESNTKAVEIDTEMIIIGGLGRSGDMERTCFCGTAERLLRCIAKPVICVAAKADY